MFIKSYGDCIGTGGLLRVVGFGTEWFWNRKLVIWEYLFTIFKRCAEAPKYFIQSQSLNLGKAVLCTSLRRLPTGREIAKWTETAMLNYENVEAVF